MRTPISTLLLVASIVSFGPALSRSDEEISKDGTITFRVSRSGTPGGRAKECMNADGKVVLRIEDVPTVRKLRLYDVATNKMLGEINAYDFRITAITIAPDNRTIAAGSTWNDGGGCVRVWDITTGKRLGFWSTGRTASLEFDEKSTTLTIIAAPKPKS